MTGKQRVFAAFAGQATDVTAWVPFAGIHAGKLKGYKARQVLTDPEALFESLLEVNKIYSPDGQPVIFDLQVEAEALGCALLWSDTSPPTVCSHPMADGIFIPTTLPQKDQGRIGFCLDVMRRMKIAVGETTALYGLLTGPFTLASHLRGTEILMDLVLEPENAKKLLAYCLDVAKTMAGYYIESGMDIIAAVDPMASQISPAHFYEFLEPVYSELFAFIRAKKVLSSFFVCGNATHNIEPMCKTHPDGISVDENVDIIKAKEITSAYSIAIGGNLPLTTSMLLGNQASNARSALALIEKAGGGRFILSPGCDMPYDTPVENVIAVAHAAHNPALAQKIIAGSADTEDTFDIPVELPEYRRLAKPLVEVFTLDSTTCAACAYMMEAAREMKKTFGDNIEIIEYPYTQRENVARCRAMGVKSLPSIYVNGQLFRSSIIPTRQDFTALIKQFLADA